jgi:hypothetical protein
MQTTDIKKFQEAFQKAEEAIRFADLSITTLAKTTPSEDCCESAPKAPKGIAIASVNELRYASHHFTCFLLCDSEEDQKEQLQRALRHCYRSRYDALRAAVLFMVRDFKIFSEDYKDVPHDIDGMDNHRRIVETVIDFTCKEPHGDTEEQCCRLQNAISDMRPFFLYSSSQRSILNKLHAEMSKQSQSSNKTTWLATIFGALFGAVAGYLLGKFL